MRFYAFVSALLLGTSMSVASPEFDFSGSGLYDPTMYITNPGWGVGLYAYGGITAIQADATAAGYHNVAIDVNTMNANVNTGIRIYARSGDEQQAFGLETNAVHLSETSNQLNYGIYTTASANDGIAYGIYSTVGGTGTILSGYFDGDIFVSGTIYNPSDMMFKKNIRSLGDGLNKVMALKPKSYEMDVEGFKDKINFSSGHKFGLIAQDVEAVLPELVHSIVGAAHSTPAERQNNVKKPKTQFKSVDYVGLIPILTKAIQEQEAKIEALEAKIHALESK